VKIRAMLSALVVFGVLFAAVPAAAAVHAGDQLLVTVYGHPELSGAVDVDGAERISLSLAGTIDVQGLDLHQIADRIKAALEPYVIKPAVDVQLKSQLPVLFVSGGPGGVLKYQPGETLSAALADLPVNGKPSVSTLSTVANEGSGRNLDQLASSRIDLRRIGVERDGASLGIFDVTALSSSGQSGPVLHAGDTIVLVDKPVAVRVAGDVQVPSIAHLWTDEPLSDAIVQAGGLNASAATSHIALARGGTTQFVALGDPVFSQPPAKDDSLLVSTAPRVAVAGLVDKPSTVVLKTNFSLLNAIFAAGGPTKWADLGKVQVESNGTRTSYDITKLVHGDMTQNPQLKDGDLVFVPEGHRIDYTGIFQNIISAVWLFKP
jgi:protein involved in polysaccharide export with SLBB domain